MDMCDKTTGEWREYYKRDLLPYDAGTDDGTSFESPDSVTNPKKNIFLIGKDDDTNFKSVSDIKRLGTLVIDKVEDPGVENGGNDGDDGGNNGDNNNNGNSATSFTLSSILGTVIITLCILNI